MYFIWIVIGVMVVYAIYAFVSSKIIVSMIPKKNKCRYCPHKYNCDPSNPRRVCNWSGDEK